MLAAFHRAHSGVEIALAEDTSDKGGQASPHDPHRESMQDRRQVAGTASSSAWYALNHSMKRGMPTEIGVVGANPMSRWIAEMSA